MKVKKRFLVVYQHKVIFCLNQQTCKNKTYAFYLLLFKHEYEEESCISLPVLSCFELNLPKADPAPAVWIFGEVWHWICVKGHQNNSQTTRILSCWDSASRFFKFLDQPLFTASTCQLLDLDTIYSINYKFIYYLWHKTTHNNQT